MLPECDPPIPKEERDRWRRRILAFAIAVALILLVGTWFGRHLPLRSPGRIAIALIQGAASAALILATILPMRAYDELQRRIQLEALAIAFAGTAIICTAYGFLINAGLPQIDWGSWIWPGMMVLWVLGLVIANRRYR